MQVALLTDRINNKLDKSNLINEHVLNREPVPLIQFGICLFCLFCFVFCSYFVLIFFFE